MIVLGLTGPTGAGKSTVADRFRKAGACIIDADRLAREITQPGHIGLRKLAAHFGEDILNADGTLDRALLASRAFASKEATAALNAITHPLIIARTKELLAACRAPLAVIDAPLLFESGMDTLCDLTVAVTAPLAVRKRRIMARDGLSESRADERIRAQHDDSYYAAYATKLLLNDGDLAQLTARADALIEEVS